MKVFAIVATSADGYIGADENHRATSWTTKADTQFFVSKTKEAGTVIMGSKTFATFNKPLKDRRLIIYSYEPESIKVEGVEFTNEQPDQLIARLEKEGTKAVAIGGGASIYTQFINAGIVDEIYITVMPKLFGDGLLLFNELIDKNLQLIDSRILEDDNSVLLHYKILK